MINDTQKITSDLFEKLTHASNELKSSKRRGEYWPEQEMKVRKLQFKINESGNETMFGVSVSEDNLIMLTEMLILAEIFRQDYTRQSCDVVAISFSYQFNVAFSDTLQELLEIPLQNSNFRKRLTEHFAKHAISLFREEGTQWLEDVLAWEK